MSDIKIRSVEQGDRDWLVVTHRDHYARSDGFDASFTTLVADIVDGFLADHDPQCERGWIAEMGKERVGCIFCTKIDEETAQLRLFFIGAQARGQGLGKRLLSTCMSFAKSCGYKGMRLWTHQSHTAACALYKRQGWHCIDTEPKRSFGQDVVVETYIYPF